MLYKTSLPPWTESPRGVGHLFLNSVDRSRQRESPRSRRILQMEKEQKKTLRTGRRSKRPVGGCCFVVGRDSGGTVVL